MTLKIIEYANTKTPYDWWLNPLILISTVLFWCWVCYILIKTYKKNGKK